MGAHLTRQGVMEPPRAGLRSMPIGDLTAFIAYVMQILISVMMATIMSAMIPRARPTSSPSNAPSRGGG